MFGNPETTPGGKALKFYASVRMDIRRIGAIKQTDGAVTGNRTKVKMVKNKVAPPFTEAEFDIMYNEGISTTGSLLDLALEKGIIEKRGSWLSYKGSQLAQGRDAAKEVLKNDPAIYAEIETAVLASLEAGAEYEVGRDGSPSQSARFGWGFDSDRAASMPVTTGPSLPVESALLTGWSECPLLSYVPPPSRLLHPPAQPVHRPL